MQLQEVNIYVRGKCEFKSSSKEEQMTFIQRDDGTQLCIICYTFCYEYKIEQEEVKVEKNRENVCQCKQHKDLSQLKKSFDTMFKNLKFSRQILPINAFLTYLMDNDKSILAQTWKESFQGIKNDHIEINQDIEGQKFEWDIYNIETIDQRATVVNVFNKDIAPEMYMSLDIRKLDSHITLDYIQKVYEYPERSFGQPIYNSTLNFHTYLLQFFINIHFKRDFCKLIQINAETLKYTTIQQRQKQKMINRFLIEKKYFSNTLNIHKFMHTVIENFVPTIHWRWIGGHHKVHILSLEIIRDLFGYGVLEPEEQQSLLQLLITKINNFKILEKSIDDDSQNINQFWIDKWRQGMIQIRKIYMEIILFLTYEFFDSQILAHGTESFEKYGEQLFSSAEIRTYHDIVLNYVLNQKVINGQNLISIEIEYLCTEFFNILYNYNDGYSLNLTNAIQAQVPQSTKAVKNLNFQMLEDLISHYLAQKEGSFDEEAAAESFYKCVQSFYDSQFDEFEYILFPKLVLTANLFKQYFLNNKQIGKEISRTLQKQLLDGRLCLLFQKSQSQNM